MTDANEKKFHIFPIFANFETQEKKKWMYGVSEHNYWLKNATKTIYERI